MRTPEWIRWWLAGAVLLVPLAVLPGAADPYLPYKEAVWEAWFALGTVLAAHTIFPRKVRSDPLFPALLLLLGAAVASSVGAVNPSAAALEILRWVRLGATVVVVASALPDDSVSTAARRAAVAAGAILSGVVLLEHAGFGAGGRGGRISGLFGANHLVGSFLCTSPVLVLPDLRRAGRAGIPLAALVLLTGATFLTYSRAAWIGLTVSAFAWIALMWNRPRLRPPVGRLAAAGLLVAAPAAVVVLLGLGPSAADLRSMAERSETARLAVWSASLRVFAEHPLLGAGPGQWAAAARRYAVPAETPFAARSDALQYAAEIGLIGLGAALVAIVTLGRGQWRHLRRGPGDEEATAWTSALLGLAANAVLASTFRQAATMVLAAVGAAIVHGRARDTAGEYPSVPAPARGRRALFAAAVVVATLALTTTSLVATWRLETAAAALAGGRAAEAKEAAEAAARLAPHRAEAHALLGRAAAVAGQLDEARSAFRRALSLSPHDVAVRFYLAQVERRAGRLDAALGEALRAVEEDPALDDEARRAARRGLTAGPTDADRIRALDAHLGKISPSP